MTMPVATDSTGGPAIRHFGGSPGGKRHAGTPEATGIAAVGDAEPTGTTSAATGNEAGPQADTRGVARYAAARHSYRWCNPPTRGRATTAASPSRCGATDRDAGVALSRPRWVRSSW